MRMAGFFVFLLFLAAFALITLIGREAGDVAATDGASAPALVGRTWSAMRFDDQAIASGTPPHFVIDAEGRISGDGGCNFFNGTADVDESKFAVGALRATRKACEPAVMAGEDALFRVFGAARGYSIVDNELSLTDDDGEVIAVFMADGTEP